MDVGNKTNVLHIQKNESFSDLRERCGSGSTAGKDHTRAVSDAVQRFAPPLVRREAQTRHRTRAVGEQRDLVARNGRGEEKRSEVNSMRNKDVATPNLLGGGEAVDNVPSARLVVQRRVAERQGLAGLHITRPGRRGALG